ncbi:hypothetical protein Poli38472_012260 [Pythium oligandrum]|uniref:Glutathione S-transferase n=1 Tax=Pythium oligandrum TaxID=41045 RepID=A0A8K1CQ19_PYTOL|nr:hypothetical protein Poli38472_012260 [Pythium oligandrum]|eukprot:TMW67144.1 hypothetical protein Poli38472_012260 [Pythium oligandrum]
MALPSPPTPTSTPTLALTYFDMPGRARVLRRALALGGVRFEDRALSRDQIAALKPTLPYGMVPVLTLLPDGLVVAESQAILRYIGRMTGLYPPFKEDPLAAALVDEVLDSFDDLNERLLIPTYQEDDPEKQKALRLKLVDGALRCALELLDKRLEQLQNLPFFRDASRLFVHELVAWDYAIKFKSGGLDHIPATFIDQFKTIVAIHGKVEKATSVAPAPAVTPSGPRLPAKLKLVTLADEGASAALGRAVAVQLALRIAGLAFEDQRLSREEFEKQKHAFPNAQLPVLIVVASEGHTEEIVLAQSFAMLRYIGTLGGLYPAGDDDARRALKIDELLSHMAELYFFFDPVYQNLRPDETTGIHQALAEDVVPESLEALEKRLTQWSSKGENASPFALGGDTLTVVDLAVFALVEMLTSDAVAYIPNAIVAPYKRILCAHETVRQYPLDD